MSKDISIHNLYNDVLKELPFTVSGNASIEKTIFRFLQKVAESPFLVENKQIKFVMGGFAKIKLHDLQHLFQQRWEAKRLNSFFYYDYEEDDVELLLSIYQYCLSVITEETIDGNTRTKNITNIICDNNYGGVNFRIKVASNISKIKIIFNRRDNVLEALIPKSFYKPTFNVNELISESTGIIPKVERSKLNLYEYFRKDSSSNYNILIDKIFETGKTPANFKASFQDFVLNAHIDASVKQNILNNETAKMEDIYCLFFVGGLLAYLLNCNIEYFTSVANTVGGRKYSLGSIAVGYKSEQLSNDTRAFFSITSNHIASNLASQILLDSSNMQYYLTRRLEQEQFIKDFLAHYSLESHTPHCGKNNGTDFNIANKELTEEDGVYSLGSNSYKKAEIEKSFGKGFSNYLQQVLNSNQIDWGLYEGFHGGAKCCKTINKFYEKCKKTDCDGIGLTLQANQINPNNEATNLDKPIANVYLPHLLIDTINGDTTKPIVSIKTETKGAKAFIEVEYKNEIDIGNLITALNIETEVGGSFPNFIKESYEAFRVCGDLVIKETTGTFKISLKNDFKVITENNKTNFVFVGNPNPIVATKTLTFEIHYNLF